MGSVRQIYLKKTGNHPLWEYQSVETDRKLGADEVQVDIVYSGLNFADVMMGLGLYPDAPPLPYIPGYEASGVIRALGSDIKDLSIGQRVCVGSAFGAYQSSVCVSRWQVVAIPENINLEQGASLIVSFLTAYAIFCKLARVKKEDHVLIDCGTGALGRISIQLLQYLGVSRITALTRSLDKIKSLEEQGVRAYLHQDLSPKERFDVILNSRGGLSIRRDYQRLKSCGRMVNIGASSLVRNGRKNYFHMIKEMWGMRGFLPIGLMNDNRGVMGLNALRLFDEPEIIKEALAFLEKHPIFKPHVDKVFEASQVCEALEYLGTGKSRGKVLLKW